MATKVEEVVVESDRVHAEKLTPPVDEGRLDSSRVGHRSGFRGHRGTWPVQIKPDRLGQNKKSRRRWRTKYLKKRVYGRLRIESRARNDRRGLVGCGDHVLVLGQGTFHGGKIRDFSHREFIDNSQNIALFVADCNLERFDVTLRAVRVQHANVAQDFARQGLKDSYSLVSKGQVDRVRIPVVSDEVECAARCKIEKRRMHQVGP